GQGGALFVLGEAGLGKTSVLEEACRQAGDDLLVARARCDPMEASLPFGVLSQVVHGLGGAEDLWTATEHADARTAALYRTLRWLESVATAPVLITIDDLQWADPDSLALMGFLCRRLASLPVAVIASLRPWPAAAAELAWSLVRRGDAAVEQLLPLTAGAATEVLTEKLGRPCPMEVAERAWRLSGGNPLLLALAAALLAGEGPVSDDTSLPLSVVERSLVVSRFTVLTSEGRRWAEGAAVLGIEFRPELVGEVAGLEGQVAEAAAESVWRSGLVRAGKNGTAEFVHPLFGQLLYEDMAPSARARFHARAFSALTARRMDDLAAEHAIRANLAGDETAIRVLAESGRRALRAGAPATAANRLEAAVRLSGGAAAAPLPTELGEALLEAGRAKEAVSATARMLESDVPTAQRVSALTMLARAYFGMGDFEGAGRALESAAAVAERECPQAVALPLCRHADAVMMTAGPAAALPLAERALELAQAGTDQLRAQAAAKWGMLTYFCGDPAGLAAVEAHGRPLLRASVAQLAADIRFGGCGVLVPFASVAPPAERFVEAEAAFRAGIDEAERVGAVTAAAALNVVYGLMLLRVRVSDSLAVADRLLAVADLVPLAEPFARTIRSCAFLELGDEEESTVERERARTGASAFGIWLSLLWLDHVHGVSLVRHGRFHEASELYADVEARYRSLGIGEPCIIPWARHAVVAHARAGRTVDGERVVEWLDERAGVLTCRWPAAAANAGRAALALERGDHAEAERRYRVAIEHLEGASLPSEQAELMIEHGGVLRRDGRPREARASFRRAGELAESVGARWLAGRAGDEFAAAGGRRRVKRGAQELTAQEQRIARLAATGASDKDIATHLVVSVRTVRTHLEHVYTKLGIHSRRELMVMGDGLDALIGPK
ncbi:MAG: AAA family ATPase, partial [Actinomycetota bacterium]|nr:AAA family ATPase [Actinomycetota bacterium]